MKKFQMVSEFEVEDVPILSDVIVSGIKYFELASVAVPVTVKVADGDGDVTSQICVINPEDSLTIFEDGVEFTIKISEFMKHANLDAWKMADICCNQLVIDEAQHQWLFS
jgi:hypothetical protein